MRHSLLGIAIFLVIAGCIPTLVYAEIIQGSAESHTSVTTNIQGSGSVHTHIESTVNGQTKTLDSNQPGTYTLDNSSDDHPSSSPTITPVPTTHPVTPTTTLTPHVLKNTQSLSTTVQQLQTFFHQAIQRILSFFHM